MKAQVSRQEVPAGFLAVARVLAPQGVSGEVKCYVLSDFPERFHPGLTVYLGGSERSTTVVAARVAEPFVYLALRGFEGREAAEALRDALVLVAEQDAVALPAGTYFWHQVLGLRVEDESGETLGELADILETGANQVYVVRGERGEVLVPAIDPFLREIDPTRGRIVVRLLPGMLPDGD